VVRSRVTFKEHNLLADACGANYDLIVGRNVLIYFSPSAMHEIIRKFQEALRSGGVLFIGATEAPLGGDARGLGARRQLPTRRSRRLSRCASWLDPAGRRLTARRGPPLNGGGARR
jgi:hypothetical protein